jgi:hypothetical protein
MLVSDYYDPTVVEYSLSPSFEISSATATGVTFSLDSATHGGTNKPYDIFVGDSETKLFIADRVDGEVIGYTIGAAGTSLQLSNIGIMSSTNDELDESGSDLGTVLSVVSDNEVVTDKSPVNRTESTTISKIVINGERIERYNGFNVWRKP